MPIELSEHNREQIAKPVILPRYLIEIDYETPLLLSTGAYCDFDNRSWLPYKTVYQLSSEAARLEITDDGAQDIRDRFLVEDVNRRISIVIYTAHGTDYSLTREQVNIKLDGELRGQRYANETLIVQATSRVEKYTPSILVNAAHGFNHLPRSGTRISTGQDTYILE